MGICIICNTDTPSLHNAETRKVCDNPECKKAANKIYDAKYRDKHFDDVRRRIHDYKEKNRSKIRKKDREYYALHSDDIKRRTKKYKKDHVEEIRKKDREYYAVHGPHTRCQWCKEGASFFREIVKIKRHPLWLCSLCTEIWSAETRAERQRNASPEKKKVAAACAGKRYWAGRKCVVPGCRKKKGLVRNKDGKLVCSHHRVEIRALKRRFGNEIVFADYLAAIAADEKKDYQPVCDSCGRAVNKNKRPFVNEGTEISLLLCRGCEKLFKEKQSRRAAKRREAVSLVERI